MSSDHDSQLLKGVLSLLLLHLLSERESYGYELVQRLHEAGLTGVLEGTVYPALARLEREGRVSTRLVASRAGPARKYYRPTAAGRDALSRVRRLAVPRGRGRRATLSSPSPQSH